MSHAMVSELLIKKQMMSFKLISYSLLTFCAVCLQLLSEWPF